MNPLYRSYTQGNPFKLFLDVVPITSEDVTRAMRGQPMRRSRIYLRRNGGKCGVKSIFITLLAAGFPYADNMLWTFIA